MDWNYYTNNQRLRCIKCNDGYSPNNVSSPTYQCYSVTAIPNCAKYYNFTGGIECEECDSDYYLSEVKRCEKRVPVPQCQSYHKQNKHCKGCNSGYYLWLGLCKQRSRVFTYCEEYYPDYDYCKVTKPDYQYLYELKDLLTTPPVPDPAGNTTPTSSSAAPYTGISGCVIYQEFTQCLECNSEYYISNFLCYTITSAISSCERYSADGVCSRCKEGHLLSNNSCREISAKNCLIYESETKC